jgi:hypothetical protein
MKLTLKARDWHTWTAVVLSVPMLIVGITAIFTAHGKALELGSMTVAADWLPGYDTAGKVRVPEARAFAQDAGGRLWVATKAGLFVGEHPSGPLQRVAALPAGEVRQLLATPAGLYAAGKMGLWRIGASTPGNPPSAEKLAGGDLFAVAQDGASRLLVAHREKGWLVSSDGGRSWQDAHALNDGLASLPAEEANEPLTLARLMLDLHNGKAFLGKRAAWVWIDLLGATLTLLGLTGLTMWWRRQRRQRVLEKLAT